MEIVKYGDIQNNFFESVGQILLSFSVILIQQFSVAEVRTCLRVYFFVN